MICEQLTALSRASLLQSVTFLRVAKSRCFRTFVCISLGRERKRNALAGGCEVSDSMAGGPNGEVGVNAGLAGEKWGVAGLKTGLIGTRSSVHSFIPAQQYDPALDTAVDLGQSWA